MTGAVPMRYGFSFYIDDHKSPAGHGTAIFMAPFHEAAVCLYAGRTGAPSIA
jgi:hypothetical protein